MKRDKFVAAVPLGCLGVAIAAIEFSDIERSSLQAKVFGGSVFLGAILGLALLLYIAYVKRTRSRALFNSTDAEERRTARWTAIGASFSGVIVLAFTTLTGLPSSIFMAGLGGILSGFMISLSLAVILQSSFEKFKFKRSCGKDIA
jgi:hypothetical protein